MLFKKYKVRKLIVEGKMNVEIIDILEPVFREKLVDYIIKQRRKMGLCN